METPSKIKPAIIGGVSLGILSVIPFINNCCCLWALAGGALAAYLYIKESPVPIKSGSGATVGALTGFVAGILYSILTTTYMVLVTKADPQVIADLMMKGQPEQNRQMMEKVVKVLSDHFIAFLFGLSIFSIVGFVALAALGGVIGVAIFEKRNTKTPPPTPPPSYPYNQSGAMNPPYQPPPSDPMGPQG